MVSSLIWDLHQEGKIDSARNTASEARSKVEEYKFKTEELERRMDRLSLACQAQWELLKENTQLQDVDILDKMKEIDLRDGKADGKMGKKPIPCPKCGKMVNIANPKCIYCGTVAETPHVVGQ